MAIDFGVLAQSLMTVAGVQGCALVSRDGLTLAAAPSSEEGTVTAAWARLASLGEIEKGFVAMDSQLWVFARRGPFSAIVLAEPSARPGLILTQIEQVLLAADEDRARARDEIRNTPGRPGAESSPTAAGRFRAPLHRERAPAATVDLEADGQEPAAAVKAPSPTSDPAAATARPGSDAPAPTGQAPTAQPPSGSEPEDGDDWGIDVVELAREFGGLYREPDRRGSSDA
jgi:predicted regulator of Ras-like GTPase activity (Roadblock/LC7/MglB family)